MFSLDGNGIRNMIYGATIFGGGGGGACESGEMALDQFKEDHGIVDDADVMVQVMEPEEMDDAMFSWYLDSKGIPDPELIIRPSGELRLSNFLLWQCAYSEFYFTDVLWPDFDEAELDKAIAAYQRRDRRFGGVKK